jgi:hypothetical protein
MIQARVGVSRAWPEWSPRVILTLQPEQHRAFCAATALVLVGAVVDAGVSPGRPVLTGS